MLILFFLISFLILISTIGYGLAVTNFLNIKEFNYNYGLIGILGLFIGPIIAAMSITIFDIYQIQFGKSK